MEPNDSTQACTNLSQKLTQLSMAQSEYKLSMAQSKYTIYKVHRHLRDVNPKAYEPEVIAIGPYYPRKDNLRMMEDHKLHYLNLLLQKKGENVKKYVSAIERLESEARKCYADTISLDATEFAEMLVLDGCFIIELVRKCSMSYLRQKNDPIFRVDWIINSLQRDLILFENQIPFFILCELFDLIEVPNQRSRLMHLLLCFFNILYPGKVQKGNTNVSFREIKHLLDLIHRSWHPPPFDQSVFTEDNGNKSKRWRFISKATGLREANVKFEKDAAVNLFHVVFKNGVMLMPPLTIEDRTETVLRNLIAYEQYFQHTQTSFVTDYVKFLDCLIDSSRDVEILSRHGIIENWLGDDEVVAKMVNKLSESVAGPGDHFIYAKIFENVNKHCEKRRNRWMAKLRRKYFNSPWAIISIIVAIILLLLTITQTLFTILQVV